MTTCYKLNTTSVEANKAVDELYAFGFNGFGLLEDCQCVVVWSDKEFTNSWWHESEDCELSEETKFYTNREEFLEVIKKELLNLPKEKEVQGLQVKIKKLHKDSVIPTYSKQGDAGMDLTAVSCEYDSDDNICYDTGLAFEIPEGYVGLIFPRSSLSKQDLLLTNHVGVIDSGYRGSVSFKFKYTKPSYDLNEDFEGLDDDKHWRVKLSHSNQKEYKVGDRIGQIIIVPYPQVSFVEVDALSDTERGQGGFGSSGS
ncbi:MAG: hypothetical protein RSB94_08065 [Erysipelotrichaceae bacterium]